MNLKFHMAFFTKFYIENDTWYSTQAMLLYKAVASYALHYDHYQFIKKGGYRVVALVHLPVQATKIVPPRRR